MAITELRELEDEMKKCFRCSLCKMVPLPVVREPKYMDCCPASRLYHFHGYSGSGKSIMALSLLDGRIAVDKALADITFACTACGYCDVACKFIMDAERHLVNMKLKEHIVDEGLGLAVHREAVERLVQGGNGGPAPDFAGRVPELRLLPAQRAKVLVYGGAGAEDSARVTEKLARLLIIAGLDVGILEKEPDSGVLAYWTGHRDAFTGLAKNAAAALDQTGAATVAAVSGADLGMFRAKYPEYAQAPGAEVLHATELLARLIKKGKLKLKTPINKRVTYHDPCYLGRQSEPPVQWEGETKTTHGCMTYTDPPRPVNRGGAGVFDAPRAILKAIPGLQFAEMHRIREYSFCCGGGGGVPLAFPELAQSAASNRIAEARDIGAQCVITACHHCRRNLSNQGRSGDPLPVMDIIDLVGEAVGLED